jgi:hypothetical protein
MLQTSPVHSRISEARLGMEGTAFTGQDGPDCGGAGDDRRTHKRKRVLWVGAVETDAGRFECIALDLSLGGAKLRIAERFAPLQQVRLVLQRFGTLDAEVVWQTKELIGVRFTNDPQAIAAKIGGALPL